MESLCKNAESVKKMVEQTNEMEMFTIEVNNVFGEKYFYIYQDKYQVHGKMLAYLAAGKQLILADVNAITNKALWISNVQLVIPKSMFGGSPYIKFKYEEIASNEKKSELYKSDAFFAYTYVEEKQTYTTKGSKKEKEETFTLFSYKYCSDCKFIGFRDTDDSKERNSIPYFSIYKLFLTGSKVNECEIHDKMIKKDNEDTQYATFKIIL